MPETYLGVGCIGGGGEEGEGEGEMGILIYIKKENMSLENKEKQKAKEDPPKKEEPIRTTGDSCKEEIRRNEERLKALDRETSQISLRIPEKKRFLMVIF